MNQFTTALLMATNRRIAVTSGQAAFTTPGTTTWIVPANVNYVSFALIGGGGGGATSGGAAPTSGTSSIVTIGTFQLLAGGGITGTTGTAPGVAGGAGGTSSSSNNPVGVTIVTVAGGTAPTRTLDYIACGGGGAALLSGSVAASGSSGDWRSTGGTGAILTTYPGVGSAGSLGRIIGTTTGAGGTGGSYGGGGGGGRDGTGGGGGGLIYANNVPVTPGSNISITVGAGGIGQNIGDLTVWDDREGGSGASGVVRVIWGTNRSFPSTNIGDV